ncbi:MAG: histidine kinase, partial [Thermoanaerobaculia bacterium]|nr:histidine kinase [Thermoanaerobaculia bacterium]
AAFVNLPAGQYTFRVRPEDAGAGDAFDAVLRVRVTDHFWQRAWFRALVLVLLSAFTVFAYNRWTNQRMRLRLADLERERALEDLRVDIAQDIHDEVGSALTKIALSAQFAAMVPDQQEQDFREKLRRIGTEARNVALQLGEIVFAINPRYDRFAEVQAYFREKGREFLEEAQLSSRFDLPPAPGNPAVPPPVKRQLYMLYRECLNNIVKHAEARSVSIVFRLENRRDYLLEIRDDGKGFDPENTRQFGSGLKGMQMRAEKIGAVLEMETGPGNGTTVRVRGRL